MNGFGLIAILISFATHISLSVCKQIRYRNISYLFRKIDVDRLDQYRKVLGGDSQFLFKENLPLELLHTFFSVGLQNANPRRL